MVLHQGHSCEFENSGSRVMTALTWEKGDSETLNVEVVSVLYYAADSTAKSGPQRKRRASVLVCGLERGAGVHELGKVCMDDAVALLDGIVAREDVLGVVATKWQVKGG